MAKDQKNIQFLGKKLEIRPYHNIADIFVIPTLEMGEGLPVAPLEAMASGLVVIGSNVSGIKDILEPFPSCIFEPSNVESLKNCIVQVMQMDAENLAKLKKMMRKRAEENYSIEKFIASQSSIYQDVIS